MKRFSPLLTLSLLPLCLSCQSASFSFKEEGLPYFDFDYDLLDVTEGNYEYNLRDFDIDEITKRREAGLSSFVLIHTASCSHCLTLEPSFSAVVNANRLLVYSIDDLEGSSAFYSDLADLRGINDEYAKEFAKIYTPLLFAITPEESPLLIDIVGEYRSESGLSKALANAGNFASIYNISSYEAYEKAAQKPTYFYENAEELGYFYSSTLPYAKKGAGCNLVDISSWSESQREEKNAQGGRYLVDGTAASEGQFVLAISSVS